MPKARKTNRHADLVHLIREYLIDSHRSARWFGLRVANDVRLVPNLARGQEYPAGVLVAVCERIQQFYEREALDTDGLFSSQVIRPERLPLAA